MIQPWQTNVLNKLQGIKPSQLILTMAGRGSGKSHLTNQAFLRLWDELHNRPVERLILSEGTVYGSPYYCVAPVGGSWLEMETWCFNQFGDSGKHIWGAKETPEPQQRWYMNNRKFWFRNEQDQLMFVMKWR